MLFSNSRHPFGIAKQENFTAKARRRKGSQSHRKKLHPFNGSLFYHGGSEAQRNRGEKDENFSYRNPLRLCVFAVKYISEDHLQEATLRRSILFLDRRSVLFTRLRRSLLVEFIGYPVELGFSHIAFFNSEDEQFFYRNPLRLCVFAVKYIPEDHLQEATLRRSILFLDRRSVLFARLRRSLLVEFIGYPAELGFSHIAFFNSEDEQYFYRNPLRLCVFAVKQIPEDHLQEATLRRSILFLDRRSVLFTRLRRSLLIELNAMRRSSRFPKIFYKSDAKFCLEILCAFASLR